MTYVVRAVQYLRIFKSSGKDHRYISHIRISSNHRQVWAEGTELLQQFVAEARLYPTSSSLSYKRKCPSNASLQGVSSFLGENQGIQSPGSHQHRVIVPKEMPYPSSIMTMRNPHKRPSSQPTVLAESAMMLSRHIAAIPWLASVVHIVAETLLSWILDAQELPA